MNFKVEKTETADVFKVTELKDVQVIGNGVVKVEGQSWLFTEAGLQSEINGFQSEIDWRNEVITLIQQTNELN